MRALRHGTLALALTLVFAACVPGAAGGLRGGVLATFDVTGETFKVWVTNKATIQQLIDLRDGRREGGIPNGRILRGSGAGGHNAPWSWHLDPEDVHLADITMELCDGAPWYVEENVDEYVDNVQRYCSWAAELVGLEDLR
ncbi:MAG: hypothetical protein ACRDGE_02825 [Candidatus Limnocylindria bacterium]